MRKTNIIRPWAVTLNYYLIPHVEILLIYVLFIFCVIRLYIEPKNLLDLSKYDQRRQIGFDFTNCNVFLIATQTTFVWFLNDMQIKPKA